MEIISQSAKQTQEIGKILAEETVACSDSPRIIALTGELGSGKTKFVQGLVLGLKIKERVASPTFVVFKKYQIPKQKNQKLKWFYHFDCYRLSRAEDLKELGLMEILQDKENIVAIEWAERIKEVLPKETIWIEFEHQDGNERLVRVGADKQMGR